MSKTLIFPIPSYFVIAVILTCYCYFKNAKFKYEKKENKLKVVNLLDLIGLGSFAKDWFGYFGWRSSQQKNIKEDMVW